MIPTPFYNVRTTICNMTKDLKMYCREQGYGIPKFWPAGYTNDYAVSLHMVANDRWEEFEANVVFLLGEHGRNETQLLGHILEKLQEPVALTVLLAESINNLNIYKSLGFTLMPVRLTDINKNEYEVYIKGSMKMGGWANMMTRIEGTGCDIISIKRSASVIIFSFISSKLSQVIQKTARLICGNCQSMV